MFSKELNFDVKKEVKPSYRLDQVIQIGANGTTSPLNQPTIFEIPASVFNLSKSYLTFNYTIPASGANLVNNAYTGFLPLINQIQFYDKRKVLMLDLQNVSQYTKIIFPSNTKYKDYLSYSTNIDPIAISNTLAVSATAIAGVPAVPGNIPIPGAPAIYASDRPNTFPQFTVGAADTVLATQIYDPSNVNYLEMDYGIQSGTNAALSISVQFNFSLLKNTVLSIDKDIYFGDFTYLNIVWNAYTTAGYSFRSDSNLLTTGAQLTNAFGLTNFYLYLAVETNRDIVKYMEATLESKEGISLLIDFPYAQNFPITGAVVAPAGAANPPPIPSTYTTPQAFYVKYGSGIGLRLKKVYWTVFNTVPNFPTYANQYDNNNINSSYLLSAVGGAGNPNQIGIPPTAKITTFQTKLDNFVINQYPIDCTILQDYLLIKDKISESVLQNSNVYQYNWFWVDNFDNQKTTDHDDDLIAGIPLSTERRYDVNVNAVVVYSNNTGGRTVQNNANYTYYTFGIVQRQLIIRPIGVEII